MAHEYGLKIKPIQWDNGVVRWIDVSRLPWEEVWRETRSVERLARAIESMEIRGAPAIGVAAALGIAMAAYNSNASSLEELRRTVLNAAERLRRTRPTAYNLFWAIDRMLGILGRDAAGPEEMVDMLVEEALRIMREDIETNMRMGRIGAELIEDGDIVLTHCNTGALATAGYGTALGVIRAAWSEGKHIQVIATETRPLLQGARLTVWELVKEGIPVRLITDSMAGYVMSKNMVSKVLVGADRILVTGHVANKIGTYMLAVLAERHRIPFYVVAPTSTIDPSGDPGSMVIEERSPDEVRTILGRMLITVPEVEVYNPAFDITPPELITGIITEKGVAKPPYTESLRRLMGKDS